MKSNEIREQLIVAREEYINLIKAELLGPGSEFFILDTEHELISSKPNSRYSVGILYPQGNLINKDSDETATSDDEDVETDSESEIDEVSRQIEPEPAKESSRSREFELDETADENLDEEINLSAQYMPSSMGITFTVKGNADIVCGSVSFATYRKAEVADCMIPYAPDDPEY